MVTIGGSNSKTSINKVFAEYAGGLLKNMVLTKIDLNNFEIPLFSVDKENEQGFSKDVIELNDFIDKADGFIISLAEHNGAYSAAFKNVFDWLSRIESKVWRDKPVLLLSTSPGVRGGQTVLDLALGRFPYMGGNIIGSMSFPSFYDNFKEGRIVNSELKSNLLRLVDEFEKAI
ncbi:MAG: NAD(P)H-dependent oxidoreductase [Flavobacteriaceae bacterium]|nr:NAD(P)H-dependent oxidoreductase [Flavobacteriaceae bacterium]